MLERAGGELGDEALGSTAIFGAVDALISIRRSSAERTISTVQREGEDLEESFLSLCPNTGWVDTMGTRSAHERQNAQRQIVDFLSVQTEPVPKTTIVQGVTAPRRHVHSALDQLVTDDAVIVEGLGRRGSPKMYSLASIASGQTNS